MAPQYGNNGQLTRDERVSLYGIDCEDQVVWQEWTPGRESVKDLMLQNVALVTQKLKFRLPPSKEFDMPYPEAFKLAAGMKKSIPISFRPSKYEPRVDRVEILTKGGSFFVTVKAVVKDIALSVPHFVDFGLCPTNELTSRFIDVHNTGTLKAAMIWHAKPPFAVRAPVDTIDVGQQVRCILEFTPQSASVFDGLIVCEASRPGDVSSASSIIDDDLLTSAALSTAGPGLVESKQYKVQSTGVGKMPHLCVPGMPNPVAEFGHVSPGNRVPKTIEILNTTPVRASFSVQALHEEGEVVPLPPSPFSVSPEAGMIEPSCPCNLTFHFQSHTVKEFARQRFRISTPGGTPLVVTCTAFCNPVRATLSTHSINFGEVPSGKTYSKTLQIHNDSDRAAPYHFINADHQKGVFWFDRHMGIVPPNSFMLVSVYFGPLAPINYYKQIFCVVKGALSPLTLHLIGSAHNEKVRPAKLEQHHVDIFRRMQLDGIREYPPPSDDQDPSSPMSDDEAGTMSLGASRTMPSTREPQSATAAFLELLLPMDSSLRDVSIYPADLDFGTCSTMATSDKQIVTLSNRTSQKVSVVWMVPGETRLPCTPDERALFSVYPVQCDIKPRSSVEFAVSFRAQFESNYEGEALEAVVFQKINRTFRLVKLSKFTPPWTVAIRGMGHTMGITRNDPRLDILETSVRFRACRAGDRSYQVAMLQNPGDTQISYRIMPPVDTAESEGAGSAAASMVGGAAGGAMEEVPFRAWPMQGIIPPHQFHLIILEFAPARARNERAFVASFPVVVDYNEGQPKAIRVSGRCWEPRLSFCRGLPALTFPPTCAGITSSMTCEVKNISEIPISFECKIPTRFRSLFTFSEPRGQLLPLESSSVMAHFCPSSERVFSAPMYCTGRCVEDLDNAVEGPLKSLMQPLTQSLQEHTDPRFVLMFLGHGKAAALHLEPEGLDFGAVRACDEVTDQVVILNSSSSSVHYMVTSEFVEQEGAPDVEVGVMALRLGHQEGTVSGRCTETLEITFAPPVRGRFEYRIRVVPKGGTTATARGMNTPQEQGVLFVLRAEVQYPYVQITDLRTECVTSQPQSMMWVQFQVDGINDLYRGEVAEVERRFQAAIGIDEKKELVKSLSPFQLLLGTAAAGSRPTAVYLLLSNPGQLEVAFSFQSPSDLNLENAPYWCDEKALEDEREAHFSWVEEHGIYNIEPRAGEIPPGESLYVQIAYSHQSVGTHILPVVFNVRDGRSVLLYLKAHSVATNVGCLSVRSSVVDLQPVPINVERGPMQPVELTNSGSVAAPWRIDLRSIYEHNRENHNFEVLSVTPTDGVLEPQSSTFLHFTFTPLEAKFYSCLVRLEMLKKGNAAEELCFTLQAHGYQHEKPLPQPHFQPTLPIQTKEPVPGCGAALSIEVLDFGRCPLRAMVSRILVLINYTSEFVLSYRWEPRGLFQPSSRLQIEPRSGELAPNSHQIVVFRILCTEPIDVCGEIACELGWTHLSLYGHDASMVEEEQIKPPPEYIAFHSDHIHEHIRTNKAFIAGGQTHVSVANRLTISRFRNLMSTAAGQKFLNENLHRTVVLHQDRPTIPRPSLRGPARSGAISDFQGSMGSENGGETGAGPRTNRSGGSGATGGRVPLPPAPSSHPLYVRVCGSVADWLVLDEERHDFLILSKDKDPDLVHEEEEAESILELQSRTGDTATPVGQPPASVSAVLPVQAPVAINAAALGPLPEVAAPVTTGLSSRRGDTSLNSDLVTGVLQHIVREVMAEDDFGKLMDQMLMEDIPYFAQLEGSAPPGAPLESSVPLGAPAPAAPLTPLTPPPPLQPEVPPSEPSVEATDERLSRVLQDMPLSSELQPAWDGRSPLMLDFPFPGTALEPDSKAAAATAAAPAAPAAARPAVSPAKLASKAQLAQPLEVTASSMATGPISPTAAASGAAASELQQGEAERSPQRLWDEAVTEFGAEVDLEAFKERTGEVLDHMLLDLMDEVIGGHFDWQRPMPRARRRA